MVSVSASDLKVGRLAAYVRTAKQLTGVLHLGNRLMASLPDVAVHSLADSIKVVTYHFTKEVLFTATSGMKKMLTGTGLSRSAQAQAVREQSETIGFVLDSSIYNRFESNLYENAAEMEGMQISKSATFGQWMAKKAQDLQGATAWDAANKEFIGTALIQDTVNFMKGKYKPTDFEVADWGRHSFGTDPEKAVMFNAIKEQIDLHATKEHGGWFLNIDKWTNPEASTHYQAFLRGYTETKIVTANPASMPLGATGNGAMSFVSQYLSWSHGFIDRVYKPYMDYGKLEGVKYALKLQMATYAAEYMRGIANGKDPEDLTFEVIGVRAVQQAQILPFSFAPLLNRGLETAGWSLPEILGVQDIRFAERTGVPLIGALNTGGKMVKQAVTGNVSQASIYSMEMFVPGLQASHMKWLARDIAEFTADEFGLPAKSKQIIKKD